MWGIQLITVKPPAKDELGRRYPKKLAIAARIAPPFAVLQAPSIGSVARWARKAVFPSNPFKVVKTGNIIRTSRQKLGVVARVIDPGSGVTLTEM